MSSHNDLLRLQCIVQTAKKRTASEDDGTPGANPQRPPPPWQRGLDCLVFHLTTLRVDLTLNDLEEGAKERLVATAQRMAPDCRDTLMRLLR